MNVNSHAYLRGFGSAEIKSSSHYICTHFQIFYGKVSGFSMNLYLYRIQFYRRKVSWVCCAAQLNMLHSEAECCCSSNLWCHVIPAVCAHASVMRMCVKERDDTRTHTVLFCQLTLIVWKVATNRGHYSSYCGSKYILLVTVSVIWGFQYWFYFFYIFLINCYILKKRVEFNNVLMQTVFFCLCFVSCSLSVLQTASCCWFLKTNQRKFTATRRGRASPWRRSAAWKLDSGMRVWLLLWPSSAWIRLFCWALTAGRPCRHGTPACDIA